MRLFVACPMSPEMRRALLWVQESLRGQVRSAGFSRPENLHLTLAFLGETEHVGDAAEVVSRICCAPFPLELEGTGCFGDVWWAGVSPSPALAALAASLRAGLRAAGFSPDKAPFRPHITLARRVRASAVPAVAVPHAAMTVSRVCLMKSERLDGRLVYTEIAARIL